MIVYNHNVELYDFFYTHITVVYNHIITLPAQIEALCTHHRSFSLCCISKISCFVFKGLTRPHHYPVMFHCIFISKQSAKFKSPRKLVCLLVLHNDHVPKVLSRQAYLGCNRRLFCHDQHVFVMTYFCPFVVTK